MGQEAGIFNEHNIEVEEVISFRGGSSTIRGIASGGIKVGLGGLAPVVKAYLAGGPVHITGVGLGQTTLEYHTRPETDIQSIQDVKGKKIAVTGPDNTDETTAIQSLRNADGISPDDVEFVYAGGMGEIVTVLTEGNADVGALVPPLTFSLLSEDRIRRVWYATEHAPFIPPQVFSMSSVVLDQQPDFARRMMSALVDASQYVIDNPKESTERWAKARDIPVPVAERTMELIDLEEYLDVTPEQKYFTRTGETLVYQGIINEQPPWKEVVNQEPLPESKKVDWLK